MEPAPRRARPVDAVTVAGAAVGGPAEVHVARFLLVSTWHVPTTAERLWPVLWDVEGWPRWWPQVRASTVLAAGDRRGHGRRTRLMFRAGYRLDFTVEVTAVAAPRLVEAHVTGDLAGTGRWVLRPAGTGVATDITWDVEARRPWMRALAPVAAPVFRASHARVMAAGERGLVRLMTPRPGGPPGRSPRR